MHAPRRSQRTTQRQTARSGAPRAEAMQDCVPTHAHAQHVHTANLPSPRQSPASPLSQRTATPNCFTQMDTVPDSAGVVNALLLYRALSGAERLAFLRRVVASLDGSEANYAGMLLSGKRAVDPLAALPRELRERVLVCITDPLSLLSVAQTCVRWRAAVLGSARLWRSVSRRFPDLCVQPQSPQSHQAQMYASTPESPGRTCQMEDAWSPPQTDAPAKCGSPRRTCQSGDAWRQCASLRPPQAVVRTIAALRAAVHMQRAWARGQPTWRTTFAAHGTGVVTCLLLDDARGTVISGSDNGTVGVWDARTGRCVHMLSGHGGGVWALCALPGTDVVVSGSTDRTLIAWRTSGGVRLREFVGHTSTVRCVAPVGDDTVVSGSRDGTLRVWRVSSGQCVHVLRGHAASVRCISALPGSRTLVVSGSYDGTLRVWDTVRGECVSVCGSSAGGKVYAVAAPAEGTVVSGGTDARVRAWDTESGSAIAEFCEHSALVGLLASARVDALLRTTLPERAPRVLLAAGCTDGSLGVWDGEALLPVAHVPAAHRAAVTALDACPFGVVSGAERGVHLWRASDLLAGRAAVPAVLSDAPDVVWRVVASRSRVAVGYQVSGATHIDVYAFDAP